MKYEVEFVGRKGDNPVGDDWEIFMRLQGECIGARAEAGWRLVEAVPVATTSGTSGRGGGGRLGGVLLYFEAA